jgi:hypothetical protein
MDKLLIVFDSLMDGCYESNIQEYFKRNSAISEENNTKKSMSKKQNIFVMIILILVASAVLSLKVVRNGVCKHTAYIVCIAPDFKPERWDNN